MPRTNEEPHRLDIAIGQRIRERRRRIGLSQQEVAERLGVSFQQVQKYERGSNRISFSRLVEMASALKCDLPDLTDGLLPERAEEVEQTNRLMAVEGALRLLEAYAELPNDALRQAVVTHVRTLGRVVREVA